MRKWCVKTLFILAKWTILFCIFLFIIYFLVVHPNDQRIDLPSLGELQPAKRNFKKVGSVFLSNYEHTMTVGSEFLGAARDRISKELLEFVSLKSPRFVSPYQVYVPIGNYPWRLEGRDSLLLPAGAELVVEPRLAGIYQMNFAGAALFGKAQLSVAILGDAKAELRLDPVKIEKERKGALATINRYLHVDPGLDASRWVEKSIEFTLVNDSLIKFKCVSESAVCLLGDPEFFTTTLTAPQNFLIILVDTLRGDAISSGNAPTMARFASEGVQFKRAVAPGNMTSPSTNSLLSCKRATSLGSMAFSYSVSSKNKAVFYAGRNVSFPEKFKRQLFDTAMIGNISVVSEILGVGVDHGFSQQISIETEAYDTAQTTREAINWLQGHAAQPFLLYVHYNGPHAPYRAPVRDLFSSFPGFRELKSYPKILSWLYQGEVRYSDRYINKLLESLERLKLDANTTVILTADHGDQHSNHYFVDNEVAPNFSGAYFDHGATLLNDEINVPLVFRLPSGPNGVEVYDFTSTLDVGPTLLDLAHIEEDGSCESKTLRPFFDFEEPAPNRGQRTVGSEGFRGRAIIFDGRYKYIRNYSPTDKKIYEEGSWLGRRRVIFNSEELYDLQVDPAEASSLVRKNLTLLETARKAYKEFYHVVEGYELVLERGTNDPAEASFSVQLANDVSILEPLPEWNISSTSGVQSVSGTLKEPLIIKLARLGTSEPKVLINSERVALQATTLRLPYKKDIELPIEGGGFATLLPPGKRSAAYVRRVEDTNYQERAIVAGNPRFEKILREWGYLHED